MTPLSSFPVLPAADGAGTGLEEEIVKGIDEEPCSARDDGEQDKDEPVDVLARLDHLLAIAAEFH